MKRGVIYIIFLLLLVLFNSCSNSNVAGGTSTSENTIVKGNVVDADSNGVSDVEIYFLPTDYNPHDQGPPDSLITKTNSQGEYSIEVREMGTYNIVAVNSENGFAGMIQGINVEQIGDTTINAPSAVLKETGVLSISAEEINNNSTGYVYIPGTNSFIELSVQNGDSAVYQIKGVPSSIYPTIHFVDTTFDQVEKINRDSILVEAGDTVSLPPFSRWKYKSKLTINASFLKNDLHGIPVLIREDERGLLTWRSDLSGSDVIITKEDEVTQLNFNIETWDSTNHKVELWLRVDTLFAEKENIFYIYSGNKDSSLVNKNSYVFDSSNGFDGVWHLNSKKIEDRTPGKNNGTLTSEEVVGGIIGYALEFDKGDKVLIPHRAFENLDTAVTISLWAFGNENVIASQGTVFEAQGDTSGDNRILLAHAPFLNKEIVWDAGDSASTFNRILYPKSSGIQYKGKWNHWVFTKNSSTGIMNMYLNGNLLHTGENKYWNISEIKYFTIGYVRYSDNSYEGKIDEFRVSSTIRDPEWIRFCFENQRLGSSIVSIE